MRPRITPAPFTVTQKYLKENTIYDPHTGLMRWRISGQGRKMHSVSLGTRLPEGYHQVKIRGTFYYVHRLIYLYMTGEIPEAVAHIDFDPSNNRWSNLQGMSLEECRSRVRQHYERSGGNFLEQPGRRRVPEEDYDTNAAEAIPEVPPMIEDEPTFRHPEVDDWMTPEILLDCIRDCTPLKPEVEMSRHGNASLPVDVNIYKLAHLLEQRLLEPHDDELAELRHQLLIKEAECAEGWALNRKLREEISRITR